ncbi:MAG: tripartite tricarboxylate transporter permease, partial [Bdellovibrionales bacterium]|nr:tripartite tricarboxylate transporter permease [Bdellovibrionales bacterium]
VLLANVFTFPIGLYGNRVFALVGKISPRVLLPMIVTLSLLGSFTLKNSLFDCWICLLFGVFGWACKRLAIPVAPLILGLVLGNMLEMNCRRMLIMGGWSQLFFRPGAFGMVILALVFLISPFLKRRVKA